MEISRASLALAKEARRRNDQELIEYLHIVAYNDMSSLSVHTHTIEALHSIKITSSTGLWPKCFLRSLDDFQPTKRTRCFLSYFLFGGQPNAEGAGKRHTSFRETTTNCIRNSDNLLPSCTIIMHSLAARQQQPSARHLPFPFYLPSIPNCSIASRRYVFRELDATCHDRGPFEG